MQFSGSAHHQCTFEIEEATEKGIHQSRLPGGAGDLTGSDELSEDEVLVRDCLSGSEEAWSTLVDKYRRLIFSIPIKYGFSRDDASEVFQEVCFRMLSELGRLRQPRTLAAWLIKVTIRECSLASKERARYVILDDDEPEAGCTFQDALMEELQLQQSVREAVAKLNGRCRRLVDMLFFTSPPIPYEEVAQHLGVAKGSIGFIRMRCIKQVRRILENSTLYSNTATRENA
jgi:RNA polymerase sigma factor (sigma-70 family)